MKRLLLIGLLGLFCCAACAPMEKFPETLRQSADRDAYAAQVRKHYHTDNILEISRLGAALIVSCLYYAPELQAEAGRRFSQIPSFTKEMSSWPQGRNFLMGIFMEGFRENDVLKDGRFVPSLKTKSGRIVQAQKIKYYGRDTKFIGDFFPVFDRWEEVFLVTFDTLEEPDSFIVKWPGGTQHIMVD